MAVAYSYVRFSHPSQLEGDSLRRQTERAAAYCRKKGLTLDTALTLRDLGVSAFRGKNAAVGSFRTFLDGIQTGKVAAGSVLVVESFDRISRQGIDEGYDLIKSILKAGVKIVTLAPEREFDREATRGLTKGALEIQLILERAAEESERKADRVGAAWANKRKEAAEKVLTRRLPGWVKYDDGKLVLDKAGAATVRRIFGLAIAGNGVHAIAVELNADKVPVMGRKLFKGRTVVWNETVVYHVLRSRATYGEYQPCKGRGSERVPAGDPVANYYPAAIDRDTFLRAQAGLKSRTRHGSGRRGAHVNLFAGLLKDARDGGSLTYKHLKNRSSAIIPVGAKQGRGTVWSSFPAVALENAVRSKLAEVKTSDVAGENTAAKKVDALTARKAELVELIRVWQAKMDNPLIADDVAEKLAKCRGELNGDPSKPDKPGVLRLLAEAESEAANPVSAVWGEARTLAKMNPADDTDELRTRIRVALRRCIESIHCLFTGLGRDRLAAVRVQFRGVEAHRDYMIRYAPGKSNHKVKREGKWEVKAERWADRGRELDLRHPADAERIENALARLGVE